MMMNNDDKQPIEQPHTDVTTEGGTAAAAPRTRGAWRVRAWLLAIAFGLSLGATACVGEGDDGLEGAAEQGDEIAETSSALINQQGGAAGGKCQVTSGPYTGKKGKYDSDGWCCFETKTQNVCVECAGGRCKDSKLTIDPGVITTTGVIEAAPAVLAR